MYIELCVVGFMHGLSALFFRVVSTFVFFRWTATMNSPLTDFGVPRMFVRAISVNENYTLTLCLLLCHRSSSRAMAVLSCLVEVGTGSVTTV